MPKDWDGERTRIHDLYMLQQRPLGEVSRLMRDRHGFNASTRAYKTKFQEWGYSKKGTDVYRGGRLGAVNSTSLNAASHSNVTSHFLPILSLLPELPTEPVLALGSTAPWPLPALSIYPQDAVLQPGQTANEIDLQDGEGRTRLHHGVMRGSVQEVKDLLFSGASVHLPDFQGDQPIHYAASRASEGILRLLLRRGADINAKGQAGRAPLHIAVGSPKNVKLLLETDCAISAPDDQGDTPLHLALSSTQIDTPLGRSTVVKLIRSGADVNTRNHAGTTPFHMLLEKKWVESKHSTSLLVMCLEAGALISMNTDEGRLPFEVFLENSNFRWAEELPLRRTRGRDPTPNRQRNLDFKQFLGKGADPNTKLKSGQTLLNEAIRQQILFSDCDTELGLLLCNTASLSTPGLHGDSPLHCLLRRFSVMDSNCGIDVVKDFIHWGANPNATNDAGESPLLVFCEESAYYRNEHIEIIEFLMQNGAGHMQRDLKGRLPVYVMAKASELANANKLLTLLLEVARPDSIALDRARLSGHGYADEDWWDAYYDLQQLRS